MRQNVRNAAWNVKKQAWEFVLADEVQKNGGEWWCDKPNQGTPRFWLVILQLRQAKIPKNMAE